MDERLKHLKESMDRTVLKNGTFRPEEKQNILRAIQRHKQKRERRRRKWVAGFSIAISFCLLVGLSWVIFTQIQDQPNSMASKSTKMAMNKKDAKDTMTNEESSSNSSGQVHPLAKADIEPYKSTQEKDSDKGLQKPFYTYIVLNNYYYKETGEMVSKDKLGQEIGRIKRTGERTIKKSGDSNDIQPGPIYAIHGEDPATYIAAKGSIIRDGNLEVGYLIFKKFVPIEQK